MDIPDDVLKVAVKTAYELHHTIEPHTEVIARVILAERERCAKIAHDESGASDDDYGEAFDKGYRDAAAYIEAAIRTPPTGEEQ